MEEKNNKKRIYRDNAPTSSYKDNFKVYSDALNDIIDRDSIFNVGIVAPYGSGKSSLVKTFFDNYPERKQKMNSISLASFTKATTLDDKEMNKVEKSILEQIIFKRGFHWKSKSKIERIRGRILSSLFASLCFVAFVAMVLVSIMEYTQTLPFSNNKLFYVYFGISILLGIVSAFLLLHELKVNKLSFEKIEIEFDNDKNGSVLNQFIDEIINYCRETGIKYFVFEDIDRFNCVDLLLKLREINRLINENEKIRDKITFVYSVRDGIFDTVEDRAKFFDFVISPTPILNPGNAREFIAKAIENNDDNGLELNDSAIVEMSYYIKEMRVLNNIFNDYLFYKDTLKISKDKNEKLFAMMIYKNLSFKDFTKLQSNEGTLYKVFNEYKQSAFNNASDRLKNEIEDLKQKIDACSIDNFSEEFKELQQRISGIIAVSGRTEQRMPVGYLNNKAVSTYNASYSGLFLDIQTVYYGASYKCMDLDSLKRALDGLTPFDCEKLIVSRSKDQLTIELNKRRLEYSRLRQLNVQELINRNYFNKEDLDEIRKDQFLEFAVKNGFIDESYFEFTGKTDVELDNDFIHSVLSNEICEPDRTIQNPALVISRISELRFHTPSVLNYSILDKLIEQKTFFKDKFNVFIEYLCSRSAETKAFLCGYFSFGKYHERLVKELKTKGYSNLVSDFAELDGADATSTVSLVKTIIHLSKGDNSCLSFYNRDESIKNIIENSLHPIEHYFMLFDSNYSYVSFLKDIGVKKIKFLDDNCSSNKVMMTIFNEVVEGALFDIDQHNIDAIAKQYFGKEKACLTDYLQAKVKAIQDYCMMNLGLFVTVLSDTNEELIESQATVGIVLKHPSIDENDKKKYISCLNNKVSFVDGIDLNVCTFLLDSNTLTPKINLIENAFNVVGVPLENVASFIKKNLNVLEGNITSEDLFTKLVNLEIFSASEVDALCKYLSVKVNASGIKQDIKRSKVIQSGFVDVDPTLLNNCKNMNKSIIECLNLKPEMTSSLASVISSPDDFLLVVKSDNASIVVKQGIISRFYNILFSVADEKDIAMIKDIVLKDDKQDKYEAGLLSILISKTSDQKDKESLLSICEQYLSDKDIILVVKSNDRDLFDKLTSDTTKIAIDLAIADNNIFYKALERKEIIKSTNRRSRQCNVFVSRLNNVLSE